MREADKFKTSGKAFGQPALDKERGRTGQYDPRALFGRKLGVPVNMRFNDLAPTWNFLKFIESQGDRLAGVGQRGGFVPLGGYPF